jgi:hypothetical protein
MPDKPSVTLPGMVEKIIPSLSPNEEDTVQIRVESDHDLYRDVRIENTLTNESGGKVSLKLGSPVEITVTAEAGSTTIQSHIPVSQKP